MRILSLRLQNLNSLSGTHEVRFDQEPLSSAGVFLITGPTGVGKSTLLDSMTLALYGRAARYGNEKADEMMSRLAAECFAEVDFSTGGLILRATWRLGKTRTGNLKPVQHTLANAVTGEILADKTREVVALVEEKTGLDVHRFLRSVLLAQGQFAAFLKAKPGERAELLEKITGTEVYRELSKLAFETHKFKEERAQQLRAALGAVTVLDDHARQQLNTAVLEAQTTATNLQKQSHAATQQLHAQTEHATIVAELHNQLEQVKHLQSAQATAQEVTSRARSTLQAAKTQRSNREPVWEKAAGLAAKLQQMEKQLTESRATWNHWKKQKDQATAKRETAEKALATRAQSEKDLEAWLAQHAADAALAGELPKLRQATREWRTAYDRLAEAQRRHAEATSLKKLMAESETNHAALLNQATEEKTRLAQAKTEWSALTQKIEIQREIERKAQLIAGFDEHRQDLRHGQPCPLCGATEHPFSSDGTQIESQLQAARKLLANLEKQSTETQRTLTRLERELAKREAEATAEAKRAEDFRRRISETSAPSDSQLQEWNQAELELRVNLAQTPDQADSNLRTLEERAALFSRKQQEAAKLLQDRQKLETDLQLAKKEEETIAARLDELTAEGVSLRKEADLFKQQLHTLLSGKTLAADRQEHESQVTAAEKNLQECEALLNTLQTQLAANRAKQEQLEERRRPYEGQKVLSATEINTLKADAASLSQAFANKRTELGALEQQLTHDDQARKRLKEAGAELQAAEAEALRWGMLKELIGAADGAKFSRYAQTLTLRQLIQRANTHLKTLADRYQLTAAEGDELDLRIIDLYQAAVERPMESLSGGETFLTSLALALGLSELASQHHSIDSLFIDEGFGTLDSETLEIALSALENLRSRGKTIGLISHVELLKERLATQVRVIRSTGGTSSVKVVAGG